MSNRASVTAVIVTWNSMPDIGECLESLANQTFGPLSIVVVDSQSSDGTPDFIERRFPTVQVIRAETNLGYCAGNRLGMSMSSSDYTIVLNDDLALAPDALEKLIEYMERRPQVALASPLVLMHRDVDTVNFFGNRLTWCGIPSARAKGRPRQEITSSGPAAAITGCAFVLRRSLLEEIGGGFSPDFLRYRTGWHSSLEDADLSLRAWMAGYEVHCVAEARVYHHYSQRALNPQRWASLEYGRWLLLLRCFEWSTLLRLLPALLALEIAASAYSAFRGASWLSARCAAMKWIVLHGREIAAMRAAVQRIRRLPDRRILPVLDDQVEFSGSLGGGGRSRKLERIFTGLMRAYRKTILPGAPVGSTIQPLLGPES